MSNDLVLLGIIFLLLNDGAITTTQALLLLALASTAWHDHDRENCRRERDGNFNNQ